MFKTYYSLTKPGIIYGNVLTAAAGFLLAAKGHVDLWLLVATLIGTSLVIATACVSNNYIDRGIDKKMARTKKRALVQGTVPAHSAIMFAALLGVVGFLVLILFTNMLVVGVGLVAFIDYVVLYGIAKRRSVHGTIVGSISGAAPVVAGYVAVTNRLDLGALIVFLILVLWQMPHFYAIALYRLKDYAAAGIPVLPREKGSKVTKLEILLYIAAFTVACALLTVFGYAGWTYLAVVIALGLLWLWLGLQGFKTTSNEQWARKVFLFSLIVILLLSLMLAVGPLLP